MANRYWVGGTGTWDSSSTANWSATPGGASGASAPTVADDVFFDSGSGTAATVTVASTAASFTCTVNKSDINLSLSGNATLSAASSGSFTLTTGTLTLNSYTLTVAAFSSSNTNARTVAFGTGKIVLTGNNNTVWSCADLTNMTFTGTPTVDATYSGATGTRTISNGSSGGTAFTFNLFDPQIYPAYQSLAINLNVTAGTDILAITGAITGFVSSFNNMNFTGFSGTISASTANFLVYGNYILSTGMTFAGSTNFVYFVGTNNSVITSNGKAHDKPIYIVKSNASVTLADALNLAARQLNVTAGTFDTAGYSITCNTIFSAQTSVATSTINLNNSTVSVITSFQIFNPGWTVLNAGTSNIVFTGSGPTILSSQNITFYNVSFTSTSSSFLAFIVTGITNTLTFNNLSFPTPAAEPFSVGVWISGAITVNGTLTVPVGSTTASRVNRVSFYAFSPTATINAAARSGALVNADFKGITITGPTAPWSGTNLGDGGANTGIIGFAAPRTIYWSFAGGGSWWDNVWAASSGGSPALANFPLPQDTIIFDNAGLNTSATVTISGPVVMGSIDFSARSNAMTFSVGALSATVGSFVLNSAITISGTGGLYVGKNGTTTNITTAGKSITFALSATGSGNIVFTDNYTSSSTIVFQSGSIDLNGKTFVVAGLLKSFFIPSSVSLNGATITATGTSPLNLPNQSLPITFTGTCTFNVSSASAKFINNVNLSDLSGFNIVNTGAGALTFINIDYTYPVATTYARYGNLTTTVRPLTVNFTVGQTFEFVDFDISGTSGNLVTLQTTVAGTRATLTSPNTVNSVSFCSIKDLNATNTVGYGEWQAYTTNGNVDAGNNTGWLFSPAAASTTPRPTIRLRSLAQRGNMQ
jgi:hypothetical protein